MSVLVKGLVTGVTSRGVVVWHGICGILTRNIHSKLKYVSLWRVGENAEWGELVGLGSYLGPLAIWLLHAHTTHPTHNTYTYKWCLGYAFTYILCAHPFWLHMVGVIVVVLGGGEGEGGVSTCMYVPVNVFVYCQGRHNVCIDFVCHHYVHHSVLVHCKVLKLAP